MMVCEYITDFLKSKGVQDIFMLTGYGAMYMNDALAKSGMKYYATRNEATAPMMAEAYARIKQSIGVVCVTAGPGATNAIPGLAEAWVDSAPVLILSGQVDRNQHRFPSRSFGIAGIDIIPTVQHMTKFSSAVSDPIAIRYLLEKAFYLATSGRPGPVWLDIPLDVQQSQIVEENMDGFSPPCIKEMCIPPEVFNLIYNAKKLLVVCGQGVRQSGAIAEVKSLINMLGAPVIFSRLGQDLYPHSDPFICGHGGVKGLPYNKKIMENADVVLVLGSRLATQFVGAVESIFKSAKLIVIDTDEEELKNKNIYCPVHGNVKDFVVNLMRDMDVSKISSFGEWIEWCSYIKNRYNISLDQRKKNPIDLYYFMSRVNDLSGNRNVFITDAGSNYYVGGQMLTFEKGQREVTSGAFAAMGTGIPLAIGASIADPSLQILAFTGDGSLELNIQELKTISHYNLNIKLFVINNGGYLSMAKWQDTFFEGRRIDGIETTGCGSLNLKKISDAFDMRYSLISDYKEIDNSVKNLLKEDGSRFVEVICDDKQDIISW